MIGSPGKLVTDGRTNERTDGRTNGSEFIGPTSKVGGSKKSLKGTKKGPLFSEIGTKKGPVFIKKRDLSEQSWLKNHIPFLVSSGAKGRK